MKHCNGCDRDLQEEENFAKSSSKKSGYESRCKKCKSDAYTIKRDHYLALAKARNGRSDVLAKKRESYSLRKDSVNESRRSQRASNPGVEATRQRVRRRDIKTACIEALGGSCPCGASDVDVLCVDHINDDGQDERRSGIANITVFRRVVNGENNGRYQLLCFNCNLRKSVIRDRSGPNTGEIKRCPTCSKDKDTSYFKRDSKYPDGRYYECRACDRSRVLALKAAALKKLGSTSCPCGHDDILSLSFDHVNDDGVREHGIGRTLYSAIVNGTADRSRYQVLCMNCNLKKHASLRSVAGAVAGFSGTHCATKVRAMGDHDVPSVDFDMKSLVISVSDDLKEVVSFMEANHYAGYGRYGSVSIVAKSGDAVIAAAKFANPVRREVATSIGLPYESVLELDRMCIAFGCNKKNLASFFLSRALKVLAPIRPDVTHVVSFADPEHGHIGTIYLSTNWKDLGYGSRGYEYVGPDGSKHHKKSVYNAAISRGLKESEFAESAGYVKSHTASKRKFLYELRR